jgi:Xaa-Pro aminopeptidase
VATPERDASASDLRVPPMESRARLGRLRSAMAKEGHEALLVTNASNIRYLCGFTGSSGMLLVTATEAVLLTDGRYAAQSERELAEAGAPASALVGDAAAQRGALVEMVGDGLALEAESVSWSLQRALAELLPATRLSPARGLVEDLRRVKDDAEVARIEAAASIADAALGRVEALIGHGVTERELAARLDLEMRLLGASGSAFETIAASGPNAAMPHARPTGREIEEGDLVVVDFGAVVDGYRSDMTRTLCRGSPASSLAREVLEVVSASQSAGVGAVRAGERAAEVDRACRQVVTDAGFGEAFVHGTGHGVGLDIHEAPSLGARSADTLEEDSVVTVEPGVYLAGRCGARVEDTLVVTEDGCRVLTNFPKDLISA